MTAIKKGSWRLQWQAGLAGEQNGAWGTRCLFWGDTPGVRMRCGRGEWPRDALNTTAARDACGGSPGAADPRGPVPGRGTGHAGQDTWVQEPPTSLQPHPRSPVPAAGEEQGGMSGLRGRDSPGTRQTC